MNWTNPAKSSKAYTFIATRCLNPQRVNSAFFKSFTVVTSGPLLSRFERVPADETLKKGREHLAIYLGVMGPQDGVDYALRAIRHAIDTSLINTTFAFIGSGDSYDSLVALNKELDLE